MKIIGAQDYFEGYPLNFSHTCSICNLRAEEKSFEGMIDHLIEHHEIVELPVEYRLTSATAGHGDMMQKQRTLK